MSSRVFELFIIFLSAFIIVKGDWVYEELFPEPFWKQKLAALEKRERRDLWRVHREEWRLKQAQYELSLALMAAEDQAQCLKIDSGLCEKKVKEPFLIKIGQIEKDLKTARQAYRETEALIESAGQRRWGSAFQLTGQGAPPL